MNLAMKIIRKSAAAVLCALFLLPFCPREALAAQNFRVLASTFPIWLFCRNVCDGVENLKVELLIPALAGCPHDYAPGPADLAKLERASVLVVNGMGLEGGLVAARERVAPELPVLDAGENVAPLLEAIEDHDHHGSDHAHHHHASYNPHIFAAPRQASIMVGNIGQGLALHDPENAPLYLANAARYAEKLWDLGMRIEAAGASAPNKNIALQHDALAYLAQNADLDIVGLLPAMRNPSAAQLRRLQREFSEARPVMIATDAQYSGKIAEILSRETGIPCAALNPVANGPADAPLDYYESVMEKNLAVLEKYFK